MNTSIIIIGGGLSGLSAGCYGRMNGYKTTIFEMHSIPGGVCTAWTRKGYTVDGAVNWVCGTDPGGTFSRFWEELGVSQTWTVHNHDRAMVVENRDGAALTLYCDADRLEQHMLEIAPEDSVAIRDLTGAIRRAAKISMPVDKPRELYGFVDIMRMAGIVPVMPFMKKWSNVTVGEFVARLKNPFLREVFPLMSEPTAPLIMLVMMLAWQHNRSAGYPIGGALPLVRSIEKRYLDSGGDIRYDARVERIIVENDTAVGVKLSDGTEHRADWIVSAADGRTTIFDMLSGKYVDRRINDRYDNPNLFKPLVYVSFGIQGRVPELPASIGGMVYPLDQPITIAGKEEQTICVRSYCFDPNLTPEGNELIVVQYETDYQYWNTLHHDQPRYKAEKSRIAEEVVAGLEQRFPGISERVEMVDVATPVTWERYTGNWRGAYEGWMFDESSFTSSMEKSLPGLERFFMAGQWVNPGGGIPTAVMSGSHTIQMICRKDRKRFLTSIPER